MSAAYLNFGAGTPAPGWLNLDSSPVFALPAALHRLLSPALSRSRSFGAGEYRHFRFREGRRLPLADASAAAVYCSHVLEHVDADEIPALLSEFARVLADGGVARLVIPDLSAGMRRGLDSRSPWVSLESHLGTLPAGLRRSPVRAALEGLFGFPSLHKTMLLPERLRDWLGPEWSLRADLRYLESTIDAERLRAVEDPERCAGSLIVELTRRPRGTGG